MAGFAAQGPIIKSFVNPRASPVGRLRGSCGLGPPSLAGSRRRYRQPLAVGCLDMACSGWLSGDRRAGSAVVSRRRGPGCPAAAVASRTTVNAPERGPRGGGPAGAVGTGLPAQPIVFEVESLWPIETRLATRRRSLRLSVRCLCLAAALRLATLKWGLGTLCQLSLPDLNRTEAFPRLIKSDDCLFQRFHPIPYA